MRLRRKITVAFFLVSALVSLLLAVFLYRFVDRQLRAELRNRLRNITVIGARTVDGPAYARLRAKVGELAPEAVTAIERGDPDYRLISEQLNAIRAAEPNLIRYVYLLAPTDDPDQPRFVVDADVLAGAPDDDALSHFGEAYDVSDIPLLKAALAECATHVETDFVYDPGFKVNSVSAYVPLPRAGPGPCPGVIGVDILDTDMRAALDRAGSLAIKVSVAVIALALVVSIIMGTMMTRSLIALSHAVKRFADKDFGARTRVASRDEIGQLGSSFNTMAETIQHHSDHLESMVRQRTKELEAEKQTSERLLLNVLPAPIAARLKTGEGVIVDRFEHVSVLFADIVGFTALSARTSPESLVVMLDDLFTRFDALADRHGLEKIKTIGDAYMVVAGVPEPRSDHAVAMARMGLDMQAVITEYAARAGVELTIRIGIHSGPVVAGVIGRNKFIYDLWGDTVNTASRMESHGLPNRVHVTEATIAALGGRFEHESRGEIDVKGKGPMTTYFLIRELEEREVPPPPAPPAPRTLEELGVTVARRTVVASGPGGRDTVELVVTLPLTTAARATFGREGVGRKLSKLVKKELQTGDRGFDDAVYITTDTEAATARLLGGAALRDAIAAVIALGGTLELDGATATVALAAYDDAAIAAVDALARALVAA